MIYRFTLKWKISSSTCYLFSRTFSSINLTVFYTLYICQTRCQVNVLYSVELCITNLMRGFTSRNSPVPESKNLNFSRCLTSAVSTKVKYLVFIQWIIKKKNNHPVISPATSRVKFLKL